MRKDLKIGDILAVVGVLLLAAVCFAAFLPHGQEDGAYAQIYRNGQQIMTVSLTQPQQFPVYGDYCNTVTVENGSISITASDCPGQDCVHSGAIHEPGRSLVCLPNGLEIRVVSGGSDVDFVVG